MPAPATELGSYREIWLATLAAPTTKYSFLVRDDANFKTGAIAGRTVRFGDPVSLGSNSVWQQSTWEGGNDQERWSDSAMYKSGTADTSTQLGRIQLPPGLKNILAEKKRGITDYVILPSTTSYAADNRLWICESNQEPQRSDPTTGTSVPPTGYRVYSYAPATGTLTTVKNDLPGPVMNMYNWTNGTFVAMVVTPGTHALTAYIFTDTGTPAYSSSVAYSASGGPANARVGVNSTAIYNGNLYYGVRDEGGTPQAKLYTSTATANSLVKAFPMHHALRALAVYNNRLWFAAVKTDGTSDIYLTDGATTLPAFSIPNGLQIRKMVPVQGSLYLVGYRFSSSFVDGVIGEVWKYDGSRLSKLWSKGTGADGFDWGVYDACAYGRYLAWTLNGNTPATDHPGIMLYDTDLDAISAGPSMDMHASSTGVAIRNIMEYNNQLVFTAWDEKNYHANVNQPTGVFMALLNGKVRTDVTAAAYEGYSFESQSATLEREVLSSRYDGEPGTEAEQKVWLAGHMRVRIAAADASIVVKVIVDDATEYTVQTITYDSGNIGWRDVTFGLKSSGDYLVGYTLQYKLILKNAAASVASTSNPEVDNANFEYMLKPKKRRQWTVRAFLSDAQTTLAGAANSLTTKALQIAKLEDLWSAARPVLFWQASTNAGEPTNGTGTEVYITQWSEQGYRVESGQTTENAEVGLTLEEVVLS